ncbi:CoA pyrophosphatase [Geothrix sp. PMB-07]|uniref:NUDIX hydrolase n=1 Tax=Geothrix sp. PMB-07 TaxID=3068640 RepID=UPI0027420E7F|nr:CoA pyrophosphatase [Geothrix sp. PMB-07]WLT30504.1 CoA pyrophosphatase [Geothrix sp. PMB-07]
MSVWRPPEETPVVPWARIAESLRRAQLGPSPHKISARIPDDPRRAAVGVLLWGDAEGAKKIVLVQRGFGAPHHPGELALPGGMVEPRDRDLPATARREVAEEIGVSDGLWELGCFPDGVAKARVRFTPVFFRWEAPEPRFRLDRELEQVLLLPLAPLMDAPWTTEFLERRGLALEVPRLELPQAPLWGATAFVLKAWLDLLKRTGANQTHD